MKAVCVVGVQPVRLSVPSTIFFSTFASHVLCLCSAPPSSSSLFSPPLGSQAFTGRQGVVRAGEGCVALVVVEALEHGDGERPEATDASTLLSGGGLTAATADSTLDGDEESAFFILDGDEEPFGSQPSGARSLAGMMKTSTCVLHVTNRAGCRQTSMRVLHVTDRQLLFRGASSGSPGATPGAAPEATPED